MLKKRIGAYRRVAKLPPGYCIFDFAGQLAQFYSFAFGVADAIAKLLEFRNRTRMIMGSEGVICPAVAWIITPSLSPVKLLKFRKRRSTGQREALTSG